MNCLKSTKNNIVLKRLGPTEFSSTTNAKDMFIEIFSTQKNI